MFAMVRRRPISQTTKLGRKIRKPMGVIYVPAKFIGVRTKLLDPIVFKSLRQAVKDLNSIRRLLRAQEK